MTPSGLALVALILIGARQTPGTERRPRLDPRDVPVLVPPQLTVTSIEPSRGCRGTKDLRVTVRGQGFGTTVRESGVYMGAEDIRCVVLAVRPEAIELSVSIRPDAAPTARSVTVRRGGNSPTTGVLQNGFTVATGVDLKIGSAEATIESARLLLRVEIENLGCLASPETTLLGTTAELGQRATAKVPALAPSGTQVAQLVFPLGAAHAATAVQVALTVDPDRSIEETDEENNRGSWRGEIPAVVGPTTAAPVATGNQPRWPWILGGSVALGAAAIEIRRRWNRRREQGQHPQLTWAVRPKGVESDLRRASASPPFSLSIRIRSGPEKHSVMSSSKVPGSERMARS